MAEERDETQPVEPTDNIEIVETAAVVESVSVTEGEPVDTVAIESALARAEESLDAAEHASDTVVTDRAEARASTSDEPADPELMSGAGPMHDAAHNENATLTAAAAATSAAGATAIGAIAVSGHTQDEVARETVYVQAPVPPKVQSNRPFALGVALLAAGIFAALYLGAAWLYLAATEREASFAEFAASPTSWLTMTFFFLGFALLGLALSRASFWAWAGFGVLLGLFVYFGTIAAELVAVQAWTLTPAMAAELLRQRWLDPFVIMAAVIARELPVWLGGWIARHGRKVAARNAAALEQYELELSNAPIV